MQLQTYFVRDCELVAGWVPHACLLIIQPKQVMAQRRDSWQERKRNETTDVCTGEHEVDHQVLNCFFAFKARLLNATSIRHLKPFLRK